MSSPNPTHASNSADHRVTPAQAVNLSGLFFERVARTPDAIAYRQYDPGCQDWIDTTWGDMAHEVGRIQAAMVRDGLESGDRVAIMLKNAREWVLFDQAALGLGLVTVPLYTDDRPQNVANIIKETGAKLLVVDGRRQWRGLEAVADHFETLKRIITLAPIDAEDGAKDKHLESFADWTFGARGEPVRLEADGQTLASIVYTSGTAGRAKGVMLTHSNMLENAFACSKVASITGDDLFLSFLPLSHTLERTGGYYLPMICGSTVAFARSAQQLGEDLGIIKPTLLISVPRVYERVYDRIGSALKKKGAFAQKLFRLTVEVGSARFERRQGRGGSGAKASLWPLVDRMVAGKLRERLGGRLRYAICGGAPLSPELARVFTGIGVPVLQGYGLTEASPVVSVNRPGDNRPETIGTPLEGVQVRLGEQNELMVKSAGVMQGYWKNEEATAAALDENGWLHTGDQAAIDEDGHIRITGRLKDIIVMANGEKVPPAAMESAIGLDPLVDQVLVLGEGHHQLAALVVVEPDTFAGLLDEFDMDPEDDETLTDRFVEKLVLKRINARLSDFPGYAQIRRIRILTQPWTIEDGLMTPTQKLKRPLIEKQHAEDIEALFASR
ncbi:MULTISPECIES: long-chain fatty acid--CoA ligase [unclassified Guyparkeria]|uniref:AMP-dependent synthetase/ligase n=1 Tax=unclassified Guyparkeria TaxID=2626246 RepID=UPI0007336D5C|nr:MULTISPECIES: long-chain fatty acid--CoA ligase [unclassified Guyparkeria]KTG17638.1 AMP-dependent synthetase [Guyparkeria sp. XI15]OAE88451.1 AMP-dependent synthetase [Guyparkeria sp. WRN-7]